MTTLMDSSCPLSYLHFKITSMFTNEPHVVLVLPLDGSDPRTEVKNAVAKAESILMSTHPVQDVQPVVRRLHHLAQTINYPSPKSSAALFVSGDVEELCYMAMKVEPQVIIDEPFRIRDLAGCKRKEAEFIALVLNGKQSHIYHGYNHPLRLVSAHKAENIYAWLNEVPEKTANTARQRITLRQIESAVDAGRLEDGIDQVRSAADSRNSRLLVFEKDQPQQFYKEDSIDDIAEKVLSNGGDIKEVDKGVLEKFHHIALVRYY